MLFFVENNIFSRTHKLEGKEKNTILTLFGYIWKYHRNLYSEELHVTFILLLFHKQCFKKMHFVTYYK